MSRSIKGNASTKPFIEDCQNGTVKELLEYGLRFEDLCNKYDISHGSVQKFVRLFGLSGYSKFHKTAAYKFKPHSDRLMLTEGQKLALCTPWVSTDSERYYFPK